MPRGGGADDSGRCGCRLTRSLNFEGAQGCGRLIKLRHMHVLFYFILAVVLLEQGMLAAEVLPSDPRGQVDLGRAPKVRLSRVEYFGLRTSFLCFGEFL